MRVAIQFGRERLDLLVQIEKPDPRQQFEAFGCHGPFAFTRLIEDELGGEKIELVPLAVLPFPGEFLTRELQKIARRAGDVVAGNGGLDENRMRHIAGVTIDFQQNPASERSPKPVRQRPRRAFLR